MLDHRVFEFPFSEFVLGVLEFQSDCVALYFVGAGGQISALQFHGWELCFAGKGVNPFANLGGSPNPFAYGH